jgi:hypothetical protein
MKKKSFSVKQIVVVLKQEEVGMPVTDLIRKVEISGQTLFLSLTRSVAMLPLATNFSRHIHQASVPVHLLVVS